MCRRLQGLACSNPKARLLETAVCWLRKCCVVGFRTSRLHSENNSTATSGGGLIYRSAACPTSARRLSSPPACQGKRGSRYPTTETPGRSRYCCCESVG